MENWLNLDNKIIIVTGGTNGIGRSIVEGLLGQNAIVINFDLSDREQFSHLNYYFYETDISKKDQVNSNVEKVCEKFKRIDGLVNNAGIALPGVLVNSEGTNEYELTEEMFDKSYAVNQKGTFLVTQAVARKMIPRKEGVIINISTESAREGSVGQTFYVATKGAINSMTCTWAKELGKYNIRVIGVAPGVMEETDLRSEHYESTLAFSRNITVEELRRGYESSSNIPLGRSGKLEEVADTVCFYLSERSSYISGIITNVAGGKSRG